MKLTKKEKAKITAAFRGMADEMIALRIGGVKAMLERKGKRRTT